MNEEEKKVWEGLVNQAEWCKELARNEENIPEAQRTILAAAAELAALRSRLSLAEAVVEAARKNMSDHTNCFSDCVSCNDLRAALRARDAGKEGTT